MAGAYAVMTQAIDRVGKGRGRGSRRPKARDPNDPADAEYLRRMHPDFDELFPADLDYKTMCTGTAGRFGIPPVLEPTRTFREHVNSVDAVCLGPDPGTFVSASHDKTLKVWNIGSGKSLQTLSGHSGGIYHCAVASTRKHIISCGSGDQNNVLMWQWPAGKVCQTLKGHRRSVHHVALSGDGFLATTTDQEGTVIVHNLASGDNVLHRNLHHGVAHGSSFCREDPQLLCTVGHDGFVHLVDLRDPYISAPFWKRPSTAANCASIRPSSLAIAGAHDGAAVRAVVFADRQTIFTGGADNKLKRWDMRIVPSSAPKCAEEYLGHTGAVRSLEVSPDQRFVVTGCEDGSLRLWRKGYQAPKGQAKRFGSHNEAVQTLSGHVGIVSGCAWQEDAGGVASILSSSWDQSINLFDIKLQDFV